MTSTVFKFSCFLQISLNPMYLQKLYDSIIVFFLPKTIQFSIHLNKCPFFRHSVSKTGGNFTFQLSMFKNMFLTDMVLGPNVSSIFKAQCVSVCVYIPNVFVYCTFHSLLHNMLLLFAAYQKSNRNIHKNVVISDYSFQLLLYTSPSKNFTQSVHVFAVTSGYTHIIWSLSSSFGISKSVWVI